MTDFERMVCPQGHELTWRGRWFHTGYLHGACPDQTAAFPRKYFRRVR